MTYSVYLHVCHSAANVSCDIHLGRHCGLRSLCYACVCALQGTEAAAQGLGWVGKCTAAVYTLRMPHAAAKQHRQKFLPHEQRAS